MRARRTWAGLLGIALLGCDRPPPGPAAVDAPQGAPADEREWFWRDVLALPLQGEAGPARELLALEPARERLLALARLAPEKDPRALTTLMAALGDEELAVAIAAAHDLGAFGYAAAIPRLVKGLGPHPVDYDVPLDLRVAQASALARLGSPAGVPLLLLVLAEGTELEAPAETLPWTRTERMAFTHELALPGLVALAGTDFGFIPSSSIPARTEAVQRARQWWEQRRLELWAATEPLADPGLLARARLLVSRLGTYQLRQIDGARFALRELGPGVLPLLQEGLASPDDYVRLHALEVIEGLAGNADRKTRGRLAIVASTPLLEDPSREVASQAARAVGATAVADPLIVALQRRSEPAVLVAVLDALGATGQPAALETLRAWQPPADPGPDLRAALEAALCRLDPARDEQGLLDLLASPDASLAWAALDRLVALTGADHGLDPSQPPGARAQALERARQALRQRR